MENITRRMPGFILGLLFLTTTANAASVLIDGGGNNFGPGDSFTLSVGAIHSGATTNFDAYLSLALPDGSLLFFQLNPEGGLIPFAGTSDPGTWTPLLTNLPLADGTNTGLIPIFNYTVNGTEPIGDYQWILGIANAGSTTFVDSKTRSFRIHGTPLSNLKGTWNGSWTNTTFGSTGASLLTITDNAPGKLNITLDLDGLAGGLLNPAPEIVLSDIDSQGQVSYSGTINQLGPLTFTISPAGVINISANNLPTTGFSSFTGTGAVTGGTVNINYTINFSPSGSAAGTVTGTRQ